MAFVSSREKYLLTVGILRLLDDRYDALPRPGRVLQMNITNLRNRPLNPASMDSMRESILSLYHNLVTGSTDFPLIEFRGSFRTSQMVSPFVQVEQDKKENTTPSPLMQGPSGMMVPAAHSRSAHRTILTPVLPERTDLGALMADRRNCVRRVEVDGKTVTRVISPVFRSNCTQMTNRWRVSDYRADGHTLMSVLCQFTKESAQSATPQRQREKRKDRECSSSQLSPPKKRLRM